MPPQALIVEDDDPIRGMLQVVASQHGFTVDAASDGGEALEKLQTGHYDVILLDLMMPRVNGYDVLRQIAATQPELLRHIIIATAVPEREVRREVTHPVYKIHLKPFDVRRLLADMRNCAVAT